MQNRSNKPKKMICSICGRYCHGRQWWNRDVGYSICNSCFEFLKNHESEKEIKESYGISGVHFNINANDKEKIA